MYICIYKEIYIYLSVVVKRLQGGRGSGSTSALIQEIHIYIYIFIRSLKAVMVPGIFPKVSMVQGSWQTLETVVQYRDSTRFGRGGFRMSPSICHDFGETEILI